MKDKLYLLQKEINEDLLIEVSVLTSKEEIANVINPENIEFLQWKEGDIVYIPKDLENFELDKFKPFLSVEIPESDNMDDYDLITEAKTMEEVSRERRIMELREEKDRIVKKESAAVEAAGRRSSESLNLLSTTNEEETKIVENKDKKAYCGCYYLFS